MEKQTKNYEIGFLTSAEEDAKEVFRELESHKASILNQGRPKKVRLAYSIKKENAAYFTYVQFSMDSDLVEQISTKLRFNSKILRFMVMNLPPIAMRKERTVENPTDQPEKQAVDIKSEAQPEAPKKASSADFVDNELLEKKLEEILK